MSEWRDRHAGSQTVALPRALVDLLGKLPEPKSDKERDDLQRLRAGIEVARAIVLGADPQLLSARMIEAPATALSQVQNATSAYVSSGDAAQLTSANAYLEQVLDALTTWLQRPAREARQTVAALRRDVEEVLEDLRGEAGRTRDRAAELEQSLARVRSEIEQLVDQATADAQTALAPVAARQAELTAEISNQKSRLDAAIAQFQSQFSTAESQRAEQFATAAARAAEEHANFMTEQRQLASESAEEVRGSAEALLEEMTAFRDDARKVLSALGAEAASGGYLGQAESEHNAADRWRRVGIGLFVAIAAWGVFTIVTTGATEFTLQWLTGRLLVALPLLGIGLYALAESSRHRQTEWRARKSELDLTALDPFVALLDDEKRNELKYELAKRSFLTAPAAGTTSDDGNEVLKRLLDIVADAVKRK